MNTLRERIGNIGLIRPEGIKTHRDSRPPYYGKFIIEPFERGFGITIGNALRRILLSSIPGAAITAVRIEGAPHEFTSIPGVLEDVTDIVLNLKGVRFKLKGEGPYVFRLEKKGEGEVKAGDIETDGLAEVVNPDHHIATLNKDGVLSMELQVEMGRGYVPAEFSREKHQIGIIPLDAVFSPIVRANFSVTQTRVGKSSEFDRLVLEVWTDGTIDPGEAIKRAAGILREQLAVFGEERSEPEEIPPEIEKARSTLEEHLNKPIEVLEISSRSLNCLLNAGLRYIGDLVTRTEAEMLRIKNFGRKSLEEIRDRLHEMGLDFGIPIEWQPPEEKEGGKE
ncbi:DNA-directed RNA polymerase subunit alpha [Thermosulfurimonas sp. F29]|uniref:DNA-directed RNA polymerase subunit alpha n=1 Tax=Thermosulfurimonas sp. F29 TaxID=2867247 RepID=UPI001C839065|nr:DNA-directed RNA polymerase subunit alpha [Thermosulfurimonas sp. F29]MBX6422012.1 DNA-directed RNA polymerase subunit alpha [Thermosulfurimonas sp. F29]